MSLSAPLRPNKKQRLLTLATFDGLLAWLDEDAQQAAQKYEELRLALITFFAFKGALDPNELADETFNRAAHRLAEIGEHQIPNPQSYLLGIARNIWREVLARPYKMVSLPDLTEEVPTQILSPEALLLELEQRSQAEQKYDRFAQCLAKLSEADRLLVMEYHQERGRPKSEHRQALALRNGVTLGSLRNRVSRIRERLLKCLQNCAPPQD